ncbi:hypothetical protein H7X68_02085 [Candidatus Saccharibacteria bacterium]|nr:hypothetical protein [Candidatus Saccharibacteria bacterium]
MFPLLINPLPIFFTLGTVFGVLVHDTQIDRATAASLVAPIVIVSYGATDVALNQNDPHIHSERVSVSESIRNLKTDQPRVQTRGGDDKKYVVQKKSSFQSYGSDYSWPSI